MVIHAALDGKAKVSAYLEANRALNREVLGSARRQLPIVRVCQLTGRLCWLTPRDEHGYDETQVPASDGRLDAYTRLKIESEREVIETCSKAGIDWLIVRPTIVIGPGMGWSDGMVRSARFGLPALGGRHMN